MDNQLREQLMHICTWCLNSVPEGDDRFAFGVKVSEAIDLIDKQGEFVSLELQLINKTIVALVPMRDSEAKERGYDLIFLTCSQECVDDLKDAIELERDVFRD